MHHVRLYLMHMNRHVSTSFPIPGTVPRSRKAGLQKLFSMLIVIGYDYYVATL